MVMGERVDYWLFGVWPYVAAASVLIGPIVRALAAWRSHADSATGVHREPRVPLG